MGDSDPVGLAIAEDERGGSGEVGDGRDEGETGA